jgi:CubicO group peptidase (beta-lactamase class C family)
VDIPVEGELHQHLGWLSTTLEVKEGVKTPRIYWHNGATYGSSSFLAIEPTKEVKVILLSNTAVKVDPLALDLLKALLE